MGLSMIKQESSSKPKKKINQLRPLKINKQDRANLQPIPIKRNHKKSIIHQHPENLQQVFH